MDQKDLQTEDTLASAIGYVAWAIRELKELGSPAVWGGDAKTGATDRDVAMVQLREALLNLHRALESLRRTRHVPRPS